ncbi:hypothetical protein ACLOJK_021030 [Asimina triloba]
MEHCVKLRPTRVELLPVLLTTFQGAQFSVMALSLACDFGFVVSCLSLHLTWIPRLPSHVCFLGNKFWNGWFHFFALKTR